MALFSTLTEDFSTATLNTSKWPYTAGTVALTGGQLKFTGNGATLRSAATYTITNSSIMARFVPDMTGLLNVNESNWFQFAVHNDANNYVGFRITGGWMEYGTCVNGNWASIGGTPWNTAFTQYAQITHSGSNFNFYVSDTFTAGYSGWDAVPQPFTPSQTMYAQFQLVVTDSTVVHLDNINIPGNPQSAAPTGITGAATYGQPTIGQLLSSAAPTGVTDTDTTGTPTLGQTNVLNPGGVTDTDSVGTPVAQSSALTPATLNTPEIIGGAQVSQTPTPTYGTGAYGAGSYGAGSNTVAPISTDNGNTVGAPTLVQLPAGINQPTPIADPDTVGAPVVVGTTAPATYSTGLYGAGVYPGGNTLAPAGITDTETVGQGGTTAPTAGAGTYGGGLYGAGVYPGAATVTPGAITDRDTVGAPTAGGATTGGGGAGTPGAHGSGNYGDGVYPGTPATPTDPGTGGGSGGSTTPAIGGYGSGLYGAGTYTGTPTTPTTSGYGAGTYGAGTYPGTPAAPSTGGYGAGKYGAGIYPGTPAPDGDTINWPATPLYGAPLHLLGIGPWNPTKSWRGALNYGIGKGVSPARPHMQLPGVQSKQFTLRLDGGNEATASLVFARGDAVIVDEMATDLWWRRKDPRTGVLETIGRFNTSHNDLSRGDDGSVASSLQFQDYAILLGNRMILNYKDMKNGESLWPKNTPITEIMRFFVPADMGIDISILDDPDVLGKTLIPFEDLPPSNTIADTFTALKAISSVPDWEWWVDTPDDMTLPPKLAFAPKRGRDRGVVLVDIGQGSSPIASWSMRATSDTYANAIYFQGKDGAVITSIPAEITANGQRDVQDSNNSVPGTIGADKLPDLLIAAARKKLVTLADRRPTFTIVLAPGFWRGRHHIDVGDTVRIFIKLGQETLDYSYRVTEIGVDIDQADTETVTLTLGNPLASANPRSRYSPITKVVRLMKTYEAPAGSDVTVDEANLNPTPTTVNMP